MIGKEFPILEFDGEKAAMIRPENIIQPVTTGKMCFMLF